MSDRSCCAQIEQQKQMAQHAAAQQQAYGRVTKVKADFEARVGTLEKDANTHDRCAQVWFALLCLCFSAWA